MTKQQTTKNKKNYRALLAFVPYLRPHYRRLSLAFLLMLMGTATTIYLPYTRRVAIDYYIVERHGQGLLVYIGIAAVIIGLGHVANGWRSLLMAQVGQESIRRIRLDLFNHIQKLPVSYFNNMPVGKVMTRLTSDVDALSDLLSGMLVRLLGDVLVLAGYLIVMFAVDWWLALVVIATTPPLVFAFTYLNARIRKAEDTVREQTSAVNAVLQEDVSGIRVIQAFWAHNRFTEHFDGANQNLLQANLKAVRTFGYFWPIVDFNWMAGNGLLFLCGGYRVVAGTLTVGTLAAFLGYRGGFFGPLQGLSQAYRIVNRALAGAVRIQEILDMPTEEEAGLPAMPQMHGRVHFDNVTFEYEPGRPVLKNVSLEAAPGQMVALVGQSGAGKTSLINLLCRFHQPQSGAIYVDGIDINRTDLDSYRSQIALVLQDPYLFTGTIRENLQVGNPQAGDAEMTAALTVAGLADSFAEQEFDLDTLLHERGGNLSSGQRQLLSFARALLANPRVIILDEATAHVDTITERKVQQAMSKLLAGRTAFVIAHRLSTIQAAHQILLVSDGRICERGTHHELLALQGHYWRLCQEQGAALPLNGACPAH